MILPKRKLSPQQVDDGFRSLEPWITRFEIGDKTYGGGFSPQDDARIEQFFSAFPRARSILELGSLEGGHTFLLAGRPGAKVVGVEARPINVRKAEFVKRVLRVRNIRFETADLESVPLAIFGRFDAIFCSGLLYHLSKPRALIDQFAIAAQGVFIWTHYAPVEKADTESEGLKGMWYKEQGLEDPLSGTHARSFWLTLDSLTNALKHAGFSKINIIDDDLWHPTGPSVTLAAKR